MSLVQVYMFTLLVKFKRLCGPRQKHVDKDFTTTQLYNVCTIPDKLLQKIKKRML